MSKNVAPQAVIFRHLHSEDQSAHRTLTTNHTNCIIFTFSSNLIFAVRTIDIQKTIRDLSMCLSMWYRANANSRRPKRQTGESENANINVNDEENFGEENYVLAVRCMRIAMEGRHKNSKTPKLLNWNSSLVSLIWQTLIRCILKHFRNSLGRRMLLSLSLAFSRPVFNTSLFDLPVVCGRFHCFVAALFLSSRKMCEVYHISNKHYTLYNCCYFYLHFVAFDVYGVWSTMIIIP